MSQAPVCPGRPVISMWWSALLVLGSVLPSPAGRVDTNEPAWFTLKSRHFVVCYTAGETRAEEVAARAEAHYETIAADLGFARYGDFWLWDRRVRILLFPTAAAFSAWCDAPAWAAGRASLARREIAYVLRADDSRPDVLPHELAHLILSDFVGAERIPHWLAEGFSEWERLGRKHAPFAPVVGVERRIAFVEWARLDVRQLRDPVRVKQYYDQSASVVGFLISQFGGDRFGRFCRALRDGKIIDEALGAAYPDTVPNLARMEEKWRQYEEGARSEP